jgi:hypothetical protein
VLDLGQPALLSGNRAFHRLLVAGVPVQYQKDGETRGDFVRLIDWQDATRNEWLAVQQFTVKGPRHTRRPDIILFINGLPLVLIELKNRLSLPVLDNHEPSSGGRTSVISDVREALLGLGYNESEIREVLRDVSIEDGAERLLRDALQALGARRAG